MWIKLGPHHPAGKSWADLTTVERDAVTAQFESENPRLRSRSPIFFRWLEDPAIAFVPRTPAPRPAPDQSTAAMLEALAPIRAQHAAWAAANPVLAAAPPPPPVFVPSPVDLSVHRAMAAAMAAAAPSVDEPAIPPSPAPLPEPLTLPTAPEPSADIPSPDAPAR